VPIMYCIYRIDETGYFPNKIRRNRSQCPPQQAIVSSISIEATL
jgi:hypothetical protein